MATPQLKRARPEPIILKPLPEARVEIINLIDVLITLIAFFMLTTVFANGQSRLRIDLPRSKQGVTVTAHSKLILEIRRDESVLVNGNRVALDQLEAVLAGTAPETIVLIRGDRNVSYQSMIHLLDLLKKYHLSKLSFEVKKVEN